MPALQAMTQGQELAIPLPEIHLTLLLCCDQAAVESFRDHLNKAMLAMLPAAPGKH